MAKQWTFGKKTGAGFAVAVALTAITGAIAIYSLRSVVEAKDKLLTVNSQIMDEAERISTNNARKSGAVLRYLLTSDAQAEENITDYRSDVLEGVQHLEKLVESEEERQLLDVIKQKDIAHFKAVEQLIAMKQKDASAEAVAKTYDEDVYPKRQAVREAIDALIAKEKEILKTVTLQSTNAANSAVTLVIITVILAVISAILIALTLTRTLGKQISSSVGQVRSSSAELQAAANQQATGAKEQVSAMNEISTTISELLATSRQIAESAQRVSQIADETASSARTGDGTVTNAVELIAGIKRQVDQIVAHMLELGKKSQQIGSVLDIVSELAEQTNILAINATIEAAGAGEAGKRFSVVADEIRKLADRVTESTKEIRRLIDDVRSAVNTTVMATETGSKAVDAGTRQFGDVASAFNQIGNLVVTTTEAAREIELSTKQQTTAVEQVNVAISNVAQATKEAEISTNQTLQTASQLSGLSKELLLLVEAED